MKITLSILTLLTACGLFAADQTSAVTVTRLSTPEKALKFEVVVPAKLEDVWTAFTTRDGLVTWLWSDVTVELRDGGDWTVHFPGGKTGGGTITSFKPQRQLVMRAMAPEQFPTVRSERTLATFDFEPVGAQTRVTLTQTGWKQGKEWDDAYEYLAKGNAQLLDQLHYRFVKGPINWNPPAKEE
ncbi:MAG TPA: SRPBCC domain-containing protein [Bryobacteraceae bacterium]|nr:SRPBCC domain-containing protein [Bryobacteraceae bacterium]